MWYRSRESRKEETAMPGRRYAGALLAVLVTGSILLGGCRTVSAGPSAAELTERLAEDGSPAVDGLPSAAEGQIKQNTEPSGQEQHRTEQDTQGMKEEEMDQLTGGLAEKYRDNFPIGIALPDYVFENMEQYKEIILDNFNSITCENEMKPDYLLDKEGCQENLQETYRNPKLKFDICQPAVDFALEHGMKMRLHTLVWHSQTPKWFFTEDYTEDGKLADREVMLQRMEHYIAGVLGHFQENYPGLIYAVDVVNEAFDVQNGDENGVRKKDNLWYDTVGADFYYHAFVYARKYASEDMKLFYNDYGCMDKSQLILNHLQQAKQEGLIDGIGMQSHLSVDDKIQYKFMLTVKEFCKAGYEVQSTELDIGVKEATEDAFTTQGRKYRSFFKNMQALQEDGYLVTGITVWGLNDRLSWRKGEYGLLFDEDMNPKKAYLGAMQDASIPDVE